MVSKKQITPGMAASAAASAPNFTLNQHVHVGMGEKSSWHGKIVDGPVILNGKEHYQVEPLSIELKWQKGWFCVRLLTAITSFEFDTQMRDFNSNSGPGGNANGDPNGGNGKDFKRGGNGTGSGPSGNVGDSNHGLGEFSDFDFDPSFYNTAQILAQIKQRGKSGSKSAEPASKPRERVRAVAASPDGHVDSTSNHTNSSFIPGKLNPGRCNSLLAFLVRLALPSRVMHRDAGMEHSTNTHPF